MRFSTVIHTGKQHDIKPSAPFVKVWNSPQMRPPVTPAQIARARQRVQPCSNRHFVLHAIAICNDMISFHVVNCQFKHKRGPFTKSDNAKPARWYRHVCT